MFKGAVSRDKICQKIRPRLGHKTLDLNFFLFIILIFLIDLRSSNVTHKKCLSINPFLRNTIIV
jgi:hypothetical protein